MGFVSWIDSWAEIWVFFESVDSILTGCGFFFFGGYWAVEVGFVSWLVALKVPPTICKYIPEFTRHQSPTILYLVLTNFHHQYQNFNIYFIFQQHDSLVCIILSMRLLSLLLISFINLQAITARSNSESHINSKPYTSSLHSTIINQTQFSVFIMFISYKF